MCNKQWEKLKLYHNFKDKIGYLGHYSYQSKIVNFKIANCGCVTQIKPQGGSINPFI